MSSTDDLSPTTPPTERRRPSPALVWGPLALVVVLLVVVGAIATTQGRPVTAAKTIENADEATDDAVYSESNPRSWVNNPVLPVTWADAEEAGTTDDYDWGDHCDTSTGRIQMPTVYAPPCVPAWDSDTEWVDAGGTAHPDNGGATYQGVTADTIKIVYYVPSAQDLFSTAAALGVLDPPAVMAAAAQEYVDAYNEMYELYGRKVELVTYQAAGNGVDPTAARSDAIAVATDLKAFASIGGPAQTGAYADELAERGVLCIACGLAVPGSDFQKNAPYMWGTLATPEQFVRSVFDFGIANLWGRPARFAGDPKLAEKDRTIGVVYYEQDPPVFGDVRDDTLAHYEKEGYHAELIQTYLLDTSTLDIQAQTIIGRLKNAGITTVVFLGDPLMLKALTDQAAKQDYSPEWSITGTAFTDTTAAARLTEQTQWSHAFGISTIAARMDPTLSDSWQLYEWYYSHEPVAKKSQSFLGPMLQELYIGLHMAGPDLTPFTYAGGMFNYPPSGGSVITPRISFGFHGLFPDADYVGVDDFTVVWWDPDAEGPDEQGTIKKGMWSYVNGGERFLLGSDPPEVGDGVLFDPDIAVTLYDAYPEGTEPPRYDPWAGFPSAK